MEFEAVIFDMDGTLLDTLVDIGQAVNSVLQRNGFPAHPLESYCRFMGDGSEKLIARALPEAARGPQVVRTCLAAYLKEYEGREDRDTRLFPGMDGLLNQLTERGLRLAVLTNKRHNLAKASGERFLSPWPFEVVLGFRDDVPPKPDPAGALEIAQRLDLAPATCLFVGDSDVDMATARAAGMVGAGALWGYRTATELRNAGAQVLLESPEDLLGLL